MLLIDKSWLGKLLIRTKIGQGGATHRQELTSEAASQNQDWPGCCYSWKRFAWGSCFSEIIVTKIRQDTRVSYSVIYVQYLAGCRDSNPSHCDCSQVGYQFTSKIRQNRLQCYTQRQERTERGCLRTKEANICPRTTFLYAKDSRKYIGIILNNAK